MNRRQRSSIEIRLLARESFDSGGLIYSRVLQNSSPDPSLLFQEVLKVTYPVQNTKYKRINYHDFLFWYLVSFVSLLTGNTRNRVSELTRGDAPFGDNEKVIMPFIITLAGN